jgi:hypothetical protein
MVQGDGLMFKVSYMIKGENKLLEDKSLMFKELRLAFVFMKQLITLDGIGGKLMGKPTIERM